MHISKQQLLCQVTFMVKVFIKSFIVGERMWYWKVVVKRIHNEVKVLEFV